MDYTKLVAALPKWIFVFLAFALSVVIFHSLVFSECKFYLFGLPFGDDKACESNTLQYRYSYSTFNNIQQWTEIPDSKGAAICALTAVDDDTGEGACRIKRESSLWKYTTGGAKGDNACSVTCVHISSPST